MKIQSPNAPSALLMIGVAIASSFTTLSAISPLATASPLHLPISSSPHLPKQEPLPDSPPIPDAGLIVMASPYSVAETGDRFEALLNERGVTVFARIDHEAGAAGVDLELRPTQVIIFGNPRVGTPLMQCGQSMAIDLPQKLLIWENEAGDVYLGYNDPSYLASRHGLLGCEEAIARVEEILMGLTNAVVSQE